ncbi:hypothetical protein ARMGADRAFT_1034661 [Armillaria gallica]|uniref:Uncharacterized protein n=1 Tax=Armillaria gallica TaxID=47427 RepID=A0A2H3DJZ1_ARMGA|nr:hypothetical protein ARMGADRAFT_1034661 [Armillaria gallica]
MFLLILMSGPHYLLCAILEKALVLWDIDVYDSLNNWQIMEQIEGVHTLLFSLLTCISYHLLKAIHELPDRFVKAHWKVWVYRPDLVKDFLKHGPFTTSDAPLLKSTTITHPEPESLKKCKDHKLSPPVSSSQAGTSLAKTEKPA